MVKYKMIKVLSKALDILKFVSDSPETPHSLLEISEHLGLNKATCSHLLKTLVELGYLEQESPRKGYTLGPMTYFISRNGPYRKYLQTVSEPLMYELAEKIGEEVVLGTMYQINKFILKIVSNNNLYQVRRDSDIRDEIYQSAVGRVLLAYLSPDELNIFLAKKGLPIKQIWPGAHTLNGLKRVINHIRNCGYSAIHHQRIVGVAFPIKEHGKVVAALGVWAPVFYFKGDHRKKILEETQKTALQIGELLNNYLSL